MTTITIMEKAMRDGFGEGLLELGRKNKRVVALSADVVKSTRAHLFANQYPNRFFQVGVAEQNLTTIAAGLALEDFIPYACTYAAFQPGRNLDQIRISIAHNNANVKIVGSNAGLLAGYDGASHQMLEDIAIMRSLPNMTVIVPADFHQAKLATITSAEIEGPIYLRFSKAPTPAIESNATDFKIGKIQVLKDGKDVTIIACGIMVAYAIKAAHDLETKGVSAAVINCHTVKPLDIKSILEVTSKTRVVVTAEEAQVAGGLGGAIAETLAQNHPMPMRIIGVKNIFGVSGNPAELLEIFGLTSQEIVKQALEILQI